ncbi:MAG: TldD/PmbA family protein [Firmicutes bacterium]|nr:TldD/PmbA family protein [Bacillota bacterium]
MNIELLKRLLGEAGLTAWEVTDLRKRGWEFYFIRHKLDQNRAKEVEDITLKVYCSIEDGKYLGSASGTIPPTASEEEIRKTISDLAGRAYLVKNPYYTLNPGDGKAHQNLRMVSLEAISDSFIRVMRTLPETKTEDVNSYEIFVHEMSRRYLNSEGVDQTVVYPSSMLEVVINARNEAKDHEIELYRMLTSGTCDEGRITSEIGRALQYGKDKLVAGNTPALEQASVVFSNDNSLSIYEYFLAQMDAAMKYQQISRAEIGQALIADAQGDRINLAAVRQLPNSSRNFDVDMEGAEIWDRVLIRGGVAENFYGNRQFSQYLGLEKSSQVFNYVVLGGSRSAQELRQGKFLEVVEFSDFQVDEMTGDIAGEIRLGYWHDGESVKIVSGGSVSGNIREAARQMYLSKETTLYDGAQVPSVVRFENLTVTGIE